MAIKLSDLFGSMDEAFNNPKLEEMFNKTKDVAENMSKKSAERLEISRKKVELLDAKAKLAKLYEKFGKLNYAKYIGDEISEDEIKDCANAIADNKEKNFIRLRLKRQRQNLMSLWLIWLKKPRRLFQPISMPSQKLRLRQLRLLKQRTLRLKTATSKI